eukprot:UN07174
MRSKFGESQFDFRQTLGISMTQILGSETTPQKVDTDRSHTDSHQYGLFPPLNAMPYQTSDQTDEFHSGSVSSMGSVEISLALPEVKSKKRRLVDTYSDQYITTESILSMGLDVDEGSDANTHD